MQLVLVLPSTELLLQPHNGLLGKEKMVRSRNRQEWGVRQGLPGECILSSAGRRRKKPSLLPLLTDDTVGRKKSCPIKQNSCAGMWDNKWCALLGLVGHNPACFYAELFILDMHQGISGHLRKLGFPAYKDVPLQHPAFSTYRKAPQGSLKNLSVTGRCS